MADTYLSSVDGSDGDDGSTWALADATAAAAVVAAGAGGTVYVDSAHSEAPGAALTIASPGTHASPTRLLSVDRSGNPEPPTAILAGAVLSAGAGNFAVNIQGVSEIVGFTLKGGSSGNSSHVSFGGTSQGAILENCRVELPSTGTSQINIGSTSSTENPIEWRDVVAKFGSVNQKLVFNQTKFRWRGGSVDPAGSAPTTILVPSSRGIDVELYGVDLSHLGSGKSLVDVSATASGRVLLTKCKLGSSVAVTVGSYPNIGGIEAILVDCDSADPSSAGHRYYKGNYCGVVKNYTAIYRSGGGSDVGIPHSRQMVSSAGARVARPLVYDIMFWNETLNALNLACEVVSDGVTFKDDELWMEVDAMTNSGTPWGSITKDRISTILTTPANQTTSSETWTTTGLTTPTKQKLEVSVTPAEKGWVRCRICLAKPSSTVYICPLITGLGFKSGRQWQSADVYVIEGAAGRGAYSQVGIL